MATVKISYDILVEKTFKTKLFVADCLHKGILGNLCLFCNNNTLPDALCLLKNY
jgi:hypothetical protein